MDKFASLSVFFYLCYYSVNTSEPTSCETSEKKLGQCVVLQDCISLYNLLRRQPINERNIDFLRQNHCGFEGTQPIVCCAEEDDSKNLTSQTDEIASNLLPNLDICGLFPSHEIIRGVLTNFDQYPWLALLEYDTNHGRQFKCGGSLINNRYVLTAAHCVKDLPFGVRLVNVRLGEYDVDTAEDCDESAPLSYCSDNPINLGIEKKIVHDSADIALLRLNNSVPYTRYVRPICLPISSELRNKNYTDNIMEVAGWGRTENSSNSNIKLRFEAPVKSNSDCSQAYQMHRSLISDDQICAGGVKGENSCTCDSGGPLMYNHIEENYFAVGVLSHCGIKGVPSVYVRVTSYIQWIVDNLKP